MAAVQTPTKAKQQAAPTVTFLSKSRNLRLVGSPRGLKIFVNGEIVTKDHDAWTVEFDPVPGVQMGRYTTSDPKRIQWLRDHPQREAGLFFEQGQGVEAPAPDPEPVISKVMDALADLNAPAIEEIAAEEAGGYGRETVMRLCAQALTKIRTLQE